MNESDFNGSLGEAYLPTKRIFVDSSGRFEFYLTRIFGVTHFVKKVSEDFLGDPLTLESLRKEFSIGFLLNHPGIVRYFKYENNSIFEEYIEGQTLRELIDTKDSRLENKTFVNSIITQILDILDYLHKSGVVHHDIKPENIIITRIGDRVKIVDFGAAVSSLNDSTPGFTLTYKAPEEDIDIKDCRSDIYQFGIMLKEIESFKNTSFGRKFIKKATEKDPDFRFQNAREALSTFKHRKNKYFIYQSTFLFLVILIGIGLFKFFIKDSNFFSHESIEPVVLQNEKMTEPESNVFSKISEENANINEMTKESLQKESKINKEGHNTKEDNDLEKKIEMEINQWVEREYENNVYPILNEYLASKHYENYLNIDETSISECIKILDKAHSFRIELREKYKDKIGFIEETIHDALSENHAKFEQQLHKCYLISEEEKRDPEKTDSIN